MKITNKDILNWDNKFRLKFINSVSGYKGVHLIGTKSKEGILNLGLFNSIVHIGANPPYIGFIMRPDSVRRDTLNNIKLSDFYTINHVHKSFFRNAHYTSAKFEEHVSEFEKCGLTPEYSDDFFAPFVKESKIQIGLKLTEIQEIKTNGTFLIVGEVKQIQIEDNCIEKDGQLDLEKAQNICVTGLNTYSSVTKLRNYPYARVSEVPNFGKKERPDYIVYDEDTDTYGASLMPYGTSIGAPSITSNDVTHWKKNGITKFNNAFNNKVDKIKERYTELVEEFKMNELIYSCELNFEPIIGQEYHLYSDEKKGKILSLIPPKSWKKEHLGTFKLSFDGSWETVKQGG